MKRRVLWIAAHLVLIGMVGFVAPGARAQQTANQRAEENAAAPAEAHSESLILWKWANFFVLAGGLGWLIKKNAGPYYAARSRQIKKDMIEAADFRKRAELRYADVERRLAGLEVEIAALRQESAAEARAESERFQQQTVSEIAKIQVHAREQIAAAGKAERAELKRYSVELAIGLARQKIEARIRPETQDALVRGFVRHLEAPAAQRES